MPTDKEMLDWLEEYGEEIYTLGVISPDKTVKTLHCLKYIADYDADGDGEFEQLVKGDSLRECVTIAMRGGKDGKSKKEVGS